MDREYTQREPRETSSSGWLDPETTRLALRQKEPKARIVPSLREAAIKKKGAEDPSTILEQRSPHVTFLLGIGQGLCQFASQKLLAYAMAYATAAGHAQIEKKHATKISFRNNHLRKFSLDTPFHPHPPQNCSTWNNRPSSSLFKIVPRGTIDHPRPFSNCSTWNNCAFCYYRGHDPALLLALFSCGCGPCLCSPGGGAKGC